jgi:hypothetical protein
VGDGDEWKALAPLFATHPFASYGGREMLESLPDGIHSGLAKAGAKGVFFYFQGRATAGAKLHFWKYLDLKDQ